MNSNKDTTTTKKQQKQPIQFVRPMKAIDVKDIADLKFPLIATDKIDGVYAQNINGKLLGRSLKPFKNKYITDLLSREEFSGFSGELIHGSNVSAEDLCRKTTSCVNTIKLVDWEWSWHLFDYVHDSVINLPYNQRILHLNDALNALPEVTRANIQVVHQTPLNDPRIVEIVYEANLDKGLEGLILRQPDGMYKNGRSTLKEQIFLRLKPSEDSEAVVFGVSEAMQNNNEAKINELGNTERSSHKENKVGKGMVGSFLCIDVMTRKPIRVGAGKMSHQERVMSFDNPPIGSIIKYRSLATGVKDAPRHARFYSFRDLSDMDDEILECVEGILSEIDGGCYD